MPPMLAPDLAFRPDPARTARIDLAIRRSLADSVDRVLDAAAGAGVTWRGDRVAWRAALLAVRRAPPRLWAGYHALVQAAVAGDAAAVTDLASELLARSPGSPGRPGTVVSLSDADLGSADAARYRAVIDNDPSNPLALVAADAAETRRLAVLTVEARDLMADACPALLDEIDTLGHEIVLATGAGPRGFGGAASVFLWGAVLLNPERVADRVTLVESLAHETAHALLFGLTRGADLTTNDPAERYASPLRADPRPIEGIVHATYVLARMVHALEAIADAPALDEGERAAIAAKLARNGASWTAGCATVDAHARFTPEGAAIFEGCRQAMAASPA